MSKNPVNAGTGNKYQEEIDYQSAVADGLVFRRYYNSLGLANGGLGNLWRHSYERQVITMDTVGGAPSVVVRRQTGIGIVFTYWGGTWKSSKDISDKLVQLFSGSTPTGWSYYNAKTEDTETYDASGNLTFIQTRSGLTTALVYSIASTPITIAPKAGLLIQVSDWAGRQLNFTWNAQERIATLTDPTGAVYSYAYTQGNLTSVVYPDNTPSNPADNPQRVYWYENAGCPKALTGITDENNARFATYAYDASPQCRATSTQHAGAAELTTFVYNTGNTVVTDALGTPRTLAFQVLHGVTHTSSMTQPCPSCAAEGGSILTLDANGNVASITDFNGYRTNYAYDLVRNLETQRVEGLTSAGGTTPVTRTITTDWNLTYRLPLHIAEPKRQTTFVYDTHGNVTSTSVQATSDSNGSLGLPAPVVGLARTWTYTYNGSGQVLTAKGPPTGVTNTTTYVYDTAGNLTSITNILGHVTALSSYDANGRAQMVTDPNGLVTVLGYDVRGRLTSRNVGGELTSYIYDGVGQLTKVTLPDSSFLSYTYDAAHRLTQIQDNLSNKIVYTLDAMGNRTQEQIKDPGSTVVQTRARAYNTLNRLIQDIGGVSPSTEITGYGYDTQGNLTTTTDPLSRVTTNSYDALNRLLKVIDPAASGTGQGGNTQYAFDGLDQITKITDPRSLATTYTLDGLGNLTLQVSPDTGTTTQTFDTAGNLKTSIDARNVTATFSYDALNRLTLADYSPPVGSGITAATVAFTYDLGAYGKGRLTGFIDPTGTTSYLYNQKGRLTQETRVIAGVTYITGYGYDAFSRLSGIIYPSGRAVSYTRDSLGRISQIVTLPSGGSAQAVVSAVTYQPFGAVKSWGFASTTYTRTYDLDGRISAHPLATLNRTITYDAASRITAFTHNNSVYNQTFGYDNLNRVSSWLTSSTNQAYGYDVAHNRTSITLGANTYTYTYPVDKNRLSTVSGPGSPRTYSYDADGNTTADGGPNHYQYDARGRLVLDQLSTTSVGYALNGLGQRVQKMPSSAAATVFHYDQDGRVIAESTAAGTLIREYFYLNGTPVALATGPSTLYFVYPDHLDTPRIITDASNNIRWRWDSADPFGSALPDSNPSGLGAFSFNLRFPGQYFDPETLVHYNYFRDYDPGTGRYIESDPIGLDGGINTYSYVVGNPVSAIDPAGLAVLCIPGGGCIVTPPIVGGSVSGSSARPKGGVSTGIPAIDNVLNPSAGNSSTSTEQCPPDDASCEKAKSDARRTYKDLVNKRIPQYLSGGTSGSDAGHHVAIQEKQAALRDAIRRVKFYCKPLPPELIEWEAVANQTIPKLY